MPGRQIRHTFPLENAFWCSHMYASVDWHGYKLWNWKNDKEKGLLVKGAGIKDPRLHGSKAGLLGRRKRSSRKDRGEGREWGKIKENTAFMKMQWWNPLLHMLTLKIINIDARFITFKPKWPLFSCPWTLNVSCLQSPSVLHNPSHAWSSAASLEICLELSPASLCSAWTFMFLAWIAHPSPLVYQSSWPVFFQSKQLKLPLAHRSKSPSLLSCFG